jgi:4-amino-4-deoxy-L-arabinose transferase-like glycosyltransferase
MKWLKWGLLIIIIALAAILRFYKLDQIPPALNWDEVAAGYNAYTIANWGADEFGNKFPIVFKSFGDDKHPVHIYITALAVKIFGLSDFSTRASSAGIGVLSVIVIYFLTREVLKSDLAAVFSALFLAVSPYAIHFSRGLWEANFALFFFMAGLAAFYIGIRKKSWLIPISFTLFGVSFFSYHSAKVVVPPTVLILSLIHFKKIVAQKRIIIWLILVALLFGGLIIKEPRILGFARMSQTQFSATETQKYGGIIPMYWNNYKKYFTYSYLFQVGDQSARGSVKVIGEFYKIDLVLSLIGIAALLLRRKWEAVILIFIWLALSPIPGAVSAIEPGATRGIFMIGPVILLSAFGASFLISSFRKKWLRMGTTAVILIFLSLEVTHYVNYYFTNYAGKDAIEWQYGMKQIVEFVKANPRYTTVYMDKIRQQPYIFFLFYLKTPLPELLKTVKYDQTEAKSYNTVVSFDKFHFGDWNIIDSYPTYGTLYIMTPSYYGGLRYLTQFTVDKLVKYPDKTDAFYTVSGNQ